MLGAERIARRGLGGAAQGGCRDEPRVPMRGMELIDTRSHSISTT